MVIYVDSSSKKVAPRPPRRTPAAKRPSNMVVYRPDSEGELKPVQVVPGRITRKR